MGYFSELDIELQESQTPTGYKVFDNFPEANYLINDNFVWVDDNGLSICDAKYKDIVYIDKWALNRLVQLLTQQNLLLETKETLCH